MNAPGDRGKNSPPRQALSRPTCQCRSIAAVSGLMYRVHIVEL
jgi:hypothetical protein